MRKKADNLHALNWRIVDSPMGRIAIAEDGKGITDLYFLRQSAPGFQPNMQGTQPDAQGSAMHAPGAQPDMPASLLDMPASPPDSPASPPDAQAPLTAFNGRLQDTPLLRKAAEQLEAYFDGRLKTFDLPLSYQGTPFQMDDWAALLAIPYGETRSYKQIAEMIGRPKAYRAVGMANNRNPISIIIPCHRVIGHDGSLVGYGSGLDHKAFLLEHERKWA